MGYDEGADYLKMSDIQPFSSDDEIAIALREFKLAASICH
jgi:hypothetical protein